MDKSNSERSDCVSRSAGEIVAYGAEERWPFYAEDEIGAAVACLRSGRVNQWTGERVREFERAYEDFIGSGRAIALANGSVALELALRAFGIGAGDEVIVTPRSFVASAACVALVGATPVFADVDPDSGNLTADTIAAAMTPATKAVIPVHLAGWPADMRAIMALARRHGVRVIEDCAQAHGAAIDGRPVGGFGDAGAFSFCQDKIVSTGGEGGLLVFQDEAPYDWAWSYKDHGKNAAKALAPARKPGFKWLHDRIGTNWRMTEIAAAIGARQLDKLPHWRAARERNAAIWADALSSVDGVRTPEPPDWASSAYYRLTIYLEVKDDTSALRDRALAELASAGLRAFAGACPEIYREEAFAHMRHPALPCAQALGRSSLVFETHPTLDPVRLAHRASLAAAILREVIAGR